MPAFATNGTTPREELALAIVEGEGAQPGLIGDKVLGPLPLTWRNAHLLKATLADSLGLRQISANKYLHAPGTRFERATATFSDATLTVTPRGMEIVIPNELVMDYRNRFDVMAFFAARFGTQISGITKEVLIANAIFNTTNFGSATNSIVAYTATNITYAAFIAGTGVNFIGDIVASTRRLKAKGEHPPYVAVMSGPVFERVRQAFGTLQYVKGIWSAQREATEEDIRLALKEYGIEEILVGDTYYNGTADQASLASTALTQVWSNTYVWVGRPGFTGGSSGDTEGVGVPTLSGVGANVFWEGYSDGGAPSKDRDAMTFPGGNYVETYPSLETDSLVIRVKMSHNPTITNARAGDLIATQYS